ncbi:hypothetical protein QMK17_19775 [Rhodococcus sp. G-MC3]|uniref:hypothetical protein n=1 Tax=Rhodococcus sp. G-MC3 TaxID=3046209 RepID=UPI0024BAFD8D|nr:hypothetical protein [Rhodococcus sp. G-MC3]MDJ0395563.1 hypothetical protein [Rhodococcus sp. G-MC3]
MAWSRSGLAPPLYSLVLSASVLGPLLGPGYLLLRDAVSTPRSYFTDSAWGTTDAAARAVPQDAVMAALSTVVDGGIVVKSILLLALGLAGWGAAKMSQALLPTAGTPALLVASTVAIWNPYVAERLVQGHWSLLVGYAALPWTVLAALSLRRTGRWGWLAVCLTVAGLTPTGAILAAVTAFVCAGRKKAPLTLGLFLVASLPWLVATAMSGGGTSGTDPAGVTAFAARAEPGLGTLGSLAGLGGIWNSDAVPTSRTSVFAVMGTVLLLAVVALGIVPLWRRRRNPVIVALAATAVFAVLAPALGATGPGLHLGEWAATDVPGAGLLRDAQKWVALAMPFYALAAVAGVAWAGTRLRNRWVPAAVAIAAVLIALPDLVWGVGNQLKPVEYPSSWESVAAELDGKEGDVAVMPAGMFRIFPYSGKAPVLDPAPRMLPLDVLQTGELLVAGGSVHGEGTRAEDVETVLLDGESAERLSDLGVGWVLVEKNTPGEMGMSAQTLDPLTVTYEDDELALYEIPGATPSTQDKRVVVAAHAAWLVLLMSGLGWAMRSRRNGP